MLTQTKPSDLSKLTASRQSKGFSSEVFNRSDTLSPTKLNFHSRSSAQRQSSLGTTSINTQSVRRLFALQGFNPTAVKIAGNGTPVTTTIRQMHQRGTWEFFSNNRFRFTPTGVGTIARSDLFPIVGSYQANSRAISFSGSRSSSTSNSRNSASIQGSIFVQGNRFRASLNQRSVLTTVAVVNGTPFGNTIDRTVRVDMGMVRIA